MRSLSITLVLLIGACGGTAAPNQEVDRFPRPPDPPTLSDRARDSLRLGMSAGEVIEILGTPQWAILPVDDADWALPPGFEYEYRYANEGCATVSVSFDSDGVSGWDEGRHCVDGAEDFWPGQGLSCDLPERKSICGLPD